MSIGKSSSVSPLSELEVTEPIFVSKLDIKPKTVNGLKTLCKEKGIKITGLNKAQLEAALEGRELPPSPPKKTREMNGYQSITVKLLREVAIYYKLKGYSQPTKDQTIEFLIEKGITYGMALEALGQKEEKKVETPKESTKEIPQKQLIIEEDLKRENTLAALKTKASDMGIRGLSNQKKDVVARKIAETIISQKECQV